jgi:hypothetical protein
MSDSCGLEISLLELTCLTWDGEETYELLLYCLKWGTFKLEHTGGRFKITFHQFRF